MKKGVTDRFKFTAPTNTEKYYKIHQSAGG